MTRPADRSEPAGGAGGQRRGEAGARVEPSNDGDVVGDAVPDDMLAGHPETAYFWGRVAGDGDLREDCVSVRTTDERAARVLAAIAGGDRVDHRIRRREFAHDTTLTRATDEYTVQVFGDLADRAAAAFGLPADGSPGGYRFAAFGGHERQLLRGLLEGCGTICYRESADALGLSFVADDRRLLETTRSLLATAPPDDPAESLSETSSGGYWFGVADDAVVPVGRWLYEGAGESGLFAPSRRRKLRRCLDRVEG